MSEGGRKKGEGASGEKEGSEEYLLVQQERGERWRCFSSLTEEVTGKRTSAQSLLLSPYSETCAKYPWGTC